MADSDKEYVLITEYFHPDTASTGQLMTDLAVGLQDRGLDMTVYTGQPNYHSGDNGKQPHRSTYEGVLINRIRAPQVRQSSFVRRGFNWMVFTVWMFSRLLVSRPNRNRELIFVSNPPSLPIAMWLLCKIRGWDYTYIVYDIYPDMAIEPGYLSRDGLVDRAWSLLNRYIFREAKHIVALGPAMKEKITDYGGKGVADKVHIIHNWADGYFIKPRSKQENWFAKEQGLVDEFTVLYSGNIGANHDLETVLRAAVKFDEDEVTFLIIGEGDKKSEIKHLANELNLGERVKFLPYQNLEDLPYTLTVGDLSLVTVNKGMKGVCVSSKLYTSMAAGTPILVISEPGDDEARIVKEHNAGMHAEQGDVNAVAEAIRELKSEPELVERQGKNARKAFEAKFTQEQSINQYYEMLSDSCSS